MLRLSHRGRLHMLSLLNVSAASTQPLGLWFITAESPRPLYLLSLAATPRPLDLLSLFHASAALTQRLRFFVRFYVFSRLSIHISYNSFPLFLGKYRLDNGRAACASRRTSTSARRCRRRTKDRKKGALDKLPAGGLPVASRVFTGMELRSQLARPEFVETHLGEAVEAMA